MEPNLFKNLKTVYVNNTQMKAMIGCEVFSLQIIDFQNFKVGDKVKVIEKEFNTGEVNGFWCIRYVIQITPIIALMADEDLLQLFLSPFNNVSEALGLSGVQKSDNLKTF